MAGVWGAWGLMEDTVTKPGVCGWSQELSVMSLAEAGCAASVVRGPSKRLGLASGF